MLKSVSGASQRLLGVSRRRSFVVSRVAPRAYARFAQDDIRRSPSRKKGRKESQTKRNTGFLIEQARTRGRRSVLHWGIGEGVARPPHGAGTRRKPRRRWFWPRRRLRQVASAWACALHGVKCD